MGAIVSILYQGSILRFRLLSGRDIEACNAVLVAEPQFNQTATFADASLDWPTAIWPDNEPGSPVWDTPEGVPLLPDFDSDSED
jgi:hypothetical protein